MRSISALSSAPQKAFQIRSSSVSRFSRPIAPSVSRRSMAVAAMKYNVVVKGDPDNGKLGDCPFCQRVLLTLSAKGLEYDMAFVDFSRKPDWLQQVSGGKVPVLQQSEKGLNMADSDLITEYLEKEHSEPAMKSEAPAELGSGVFPGFVGFLKAPAGSEEETDARKKMEGELKALNDYLSQPGKGPFIGGSRLDAKDAQLAPRLYHARTALSNLKSYSFPPEFSAVYSYMDSLAKNSTWVKTLPSNGDAEVIAGWKTKM